MSNPDTTITITGERALAIAALMGLDPTPSFSVTTWLEPVHTYGIWVARDPEGGVWWLDPSLDLDFDLDADTVRVLAELAPHLGTWQA